MAILARFSQKIARLDMDNSVKTDQYLKMQYKYVHSRQNEGSGKF